MMKNVFLSRKIHLAWCVFFSLLSIFLVVFIQPQFPSSSLLSSSLPFYFPLLGLSGACWLIFIGFKNASLLYLLVVIPLIFTFNLHLLRPDLYFFWLCLIVIVISDNKEQVSSGFLLVLAGMYLWTAIQKMNAGFVEGMAYTFQKRILPNTSIASISILVKLIPAVEFLLAIFCITKFVRIRIVLALLIHGGILYFIIKGGWNYSMILWNVVLIILHVLLPAFQFAKIGINWKWYFVPSAAIILPVLYFVGFFPNFASWTMYSGRLQHYRLKIGEQTALYPPEYIRDYVYVKDGVYSVSISEWCDGETGGAPCMEPIFSERILMDCDSYIKSHR